jgi:hypothetical protein
LKGNMPSLSAKRENQRITQGCIGTVEIGNTLESNTAMMKDDIMFPIGDLLTRPRHEHSNFRSGRAVISTAIQSSVDCLEMQRWMIGLLKALMSRLECDVIWIMASDHLTY